MKQFRIAFFLCSLSTLSASAHHPCSPTQNHHANFDRIQQSIHDAQSEKAEVQGQISMLDYSDQHDIYKPDSDELEAFQAAKEIFRVQYNQVLKDLKKKIKHLKKDLEQLESTQIN
jgi:hypothetical protein